MGKKASSNEVTAFESAAQTILKQRNTKILLFSQHTYWTQGPFTSTHAYLMFWSYNVRKQFSSG